MPHSSLSGTDRGVRSMKVVEQEDAEIIAIGNELLNGTTLDTNSHWLSAQLSKRGLQVTRKTTIRDDLETISDTFGQAIGRESKWIFAIGGLGPTYDDKTIEALARAVGDNLEVNQSAKKMLKERQRKRAAISGGRPRRLTKASLKMVTLPSRSSPLANSMGSAPGVMVHHGRSRIIALPGVPSEMKAIYLEQIAPLIKAQAVGFKTDQTWLNAVGVGESLLAPYLERLSKRYAGKVYVKSHACPSIHGRPHLKVQIIATRPLGSAFAMKTDLDSVTLTLKTAIKKMGGEIIDEKINMRIRRSV